MPTDIGKGLLGYYDLGQLEEFVQALHVVGKEAWRAGSIAREELPGLRAAGPDISRIYNTGYDI